MTESQFINLNKDDWKELEQMLELGKKDADRLNELFVKVSSDLSYARTYYPKRMVRVYLNGLTQKVFDSIQQRKKSNFREEIINFFTIVLPYEIKRSKNALILSFTIFVLCFIIGVISTANNPDFAAQILGQGYVDMTDSNINDGDPMAVYKDSGKMNMFFGITFNNIRVAFLAFVLGIFGSLGTIVILITNGVLVGVFQYYFYSKGLFMTSFLTIWIHGTLEISAIIIAGAAGIILGNGLLFPGTFKKSTSLKIASKKALRILLSTVPLFIVAGALESFVTRLTDMPDLIKWLIILISFATILFIYVIYPFFLFDDSNVENLSDVEPIEDDALEINRLQFLSFSKIITNSFTQIRHFAAKYLVRIIPVVLIIISLTLYLVYSYQISTSQVLGSDLNKWILTIIRWLTLCVLSLALFIFYHKVSKDTISVLVYIKKYFLWITVFTFPLIMLLVIGNPLFWVLIVIVPPQFSFILLFMLESGETINWKNIKLAYKRSFEHIFSYIGVIIFCGLIYISAHLFSITGVFTLLTDFFAWHNIFEDGEAVLLFIQNIYSVLVLIICFPIFYIMFSNLYYSNLCKSESIDLLSELESFGQTNTIAS